MTRLLCSICFNETSSDLCAICRDPSRDSSLVGVVEKLSDIEVIERSNFNGHYHVLHGCISPRDGIGPKQSRLDELLERLKQGSIRELFIWLPNNMAGDATAMSLVYELERSGLANLKITRGKFGNSSELAWPR
jgi:recombination protein RecR